MAKSQKLKEEEAITDIEPWTPHAGYRAPAGSLAIGGPAAAPTAVKSLTEEQAQQPEIPPVDLEPQVTDFTPLLTPEEDTIGTMTRNIRDISDWMNESINMIGTDISGALQAGMPGTNIQEILIKESGLCLLYTSPSPRDRS